MIKGVIVSFVLMMFIADGYSQEISEDKKLLIDEQTSLLYLLINH